MSQARQIVADYIATLPADQQNTSVDLWVEDYLADDSPDKTYVPQDILDAALVIYSGGEYEGHN